MDLGSTSQVIRHPAYLFFSAVKRGVVRSTSPIAPSLMISISKLPSLAPFPIFSPIQKMDPGKKNGKEKPVDPVQKSFFADIKFHKPLQGLLLQIIKDLGVPEAAPFLAQRLGLSRRIAVVAVNKLFDRGERVMLDGGLYFSDAPVHDQLFVNDAVITRFRAPEKMKTVVVPSPVFHPMPQEEIFFSEFKRAVRRALIQDFERRLTEFRRRALIRIDMKAPIGNGFAGPQ